MQEASLSELRTKLKGLYLKNPYGQNYTHDFTEFLSDFLVHFEKEAIIAEEFFMIVEQAFTALRNGVDPYTVQRITDYAADRVPAVEHYITRDLPKIIDAVFPAEFAVGAKKVFEEVYLNK